MTSDPSPRPGMHPSIVLSAYIEPLYRGRRVAVLGDATIGLADELAERGARLVHAYDPEPARAAEALARLSPGRTHQVSYAALSADLGVRDGAFDAVIVPDLSIFADPAEILRRTRKLVSATGAAIVVVPNTRAGGRRLLPEAGPAPARASAPPGYYELFDLVSLQFAKVRMIGQAPFVGYTVADFAPGSDPEVSVDTSLLTSSEEPEHFIAVASERPVVLEPYTVIELPWSEVAAAPSADPAAAQALAESREEERLALTEARTRLSLVTAELDKIRDQQTVDAREAEQKAASTAALSARVVELEMEVEAREGRIRELEGRSGDNYVRAERLANQIRDLEEELRRQRDRGTRLSKALDDEKKARTKADLELGMIRGLSSSAPPMSEPVAAPTPRSTMPAADNSAELAAARDRVRAVTVELEAARTRISELEQEQAETLRRLPKPSATEAVAAVPVPDAKLIQRLNELESAVNAGLREAAEAAASRDAALERARKGEARAQRMLELEAALVTAESARNDLAEQHRVVEAQLAEAGPRLSDAERRIAETARRAAERDGQLAESRTRIAELELRLTEARSRSGELERKLAEIGDRRAELTRELSAARAALAEVEQKLADAERRPAELEQQLAGALSRAAEVAEARAAAETAIAEISSLEAALIERGHAVTALRHELTESERIGRELLDELLSARAPNGMAHAAPPAAAELDDLRAQLDRLAQSAARSEADLQAAGWRITQLERELGEASADRTPIEVQAELTAALAAARDEVAHLRRALGAHSS